jgi:hypothetical protein
VHNVLSSIGGEARTAVDSVGLRSRISGAKSYGRASGKWSVCGRTRDTICI